VTNLELIRRARGLRQKDVAHLAQIPQIYVSMIERGRLNPTSKELERIGRALGVSPDALLRDATPNLQVEQTEAGAVR